MRFYRCWAGTKHPAHRIPEDATDDTLLQFSCGCMGSFSQHPDVAKVFEERGPITVEEAQWIASRNPPQRYPVVRVGDLESEGA